MPYVTKHDKERFEVVDWPALTPGQLTYKLQQQIQLYITESGMSYQTIAEVLGSIEGLKLDFERRVVGPYEDRKLRENGDVWEKAILTGDS